MAGVFNPLGIHAPECGGPALAGPSRLHRPAGYWAGTGPVGVDCWLLSDTLYRSFEYVPGSTTAVSPIDHILESGRGVCQDYAHVMIAIARSWGVPTRYVSGYLLLNETGSELPESTTHAWVECQLPGVGWVGFDPTNRGLADERYVRIAVGRDYQDVAPTRGVLLGGGGSSLGGQRSHARHGTSLTIALWTLGSS